LNEKTTLNFATSLYIGLDYWFWKERRCYEKLSFWKL